MKKTNLSLHGLCMAANFQRINIGESIYEGYGFLLQSPVESIRMTVVDAWGNEYKLEFSDISEFKELVVRSGYADKLNEMGLFELRKQDLLRPPYRWYTEETSVWDMLKKHENDRVFYGSILLEYWKKEGDAVSAAKRISAANEMLEAAKRELHLARIDRMIEMGFHIGCELEYKGYWGFAKGKNVTIVNWKPELFGFVAKVEGVTNTVTIRGKRELSKYNKQLELKKVAVAA